MANIQEVLAALEGKKSPFVNLLEGVTSGFATAQDKALENAKTLIALEQSRQQMERQAQMNELGRQAFAMTEEKNRMALKSIENKPKVDPASKFKEKWSQDSKGDFSRVIEKVDTQTPTSLDGIIAAKVNSGEMTLEQAYAMKNKGQGVTPSLAYQMDKDKEKKLTTQKNLAIPGWESTGEVQPDETEAKKLRDGLAEFNTFKTDIARYKKLVQTYGTSEHSNPEVQGKMDSLAKSLQLRVKNLAQLGVLSIGDIPFIEKQIPEPGIMKFSSKTIGALDEALGTAENKVHEQMTVRGYRKAGAVQTDKSTTGEILATATNPKTGEKLVTRDGKTWEKP